MSPLLAIIYKLRLCIYCFWPSTCQPLWLGYLPLFNGTFLKPHISQAVWNWPMECQSWFLKISLDMKSWWHEGFSMAVGKQRHELPWWISAFKLTWKLTVFLLKRESLFCSSAYSVCATWKAVAESALQARHPDMKWPCSEQLIGFILQTFA